jgi:MoaA/NifB/PqqE/SkfB family radical SAM enzyme
VTLPVPAGRAELPSLSGCARQLLSRMEDLGRSLCPAGVRLLAVDSRAGVIRSFPEGRLLTAGDLFLGKPFLCVAGPALLLDAAPGLTELLDAARGHELALRASAGDGGLLAVAAVRSLRQYADLSAAIAELATCDTPAPAQRWHGRPGVVVLPTPGSPANSPAAAGCGAHIRRPAPFGPHYLNRALVEVLFTPADAGPVEGSAERMREALLAQRRRSAVPWVFNALVNAIEYRTQRPILDSFPPEIHLSITGRCNIECRFCNYSHDTAYSDYVDVERLARLSVLRNVHTLRLSSGLGEPTINPHLPRLIEHVAAEYPHILMNCFSNGTALGRPRVVEALLGRVKWINVSLNAATRATWEELCEKDLFDRVCAGLGALHRSKRRRGELLPLVYGSMVLTTRNVRELPQMPALCRSLGVDRFTAIPFFSFSYTGGERYGPGETFHRCRDEYDALYEETVREAEAHRVSIEIPMPQGHKQASFGIEVRSFYDFANVEESLNQPGRLTEGLDYETENAGHCPAVWNIAYIGSTNRRHLAASGTHYLYPCLGPLGMVDFSTRTAFDFPDDAGFMDLWNSPTFVKLRAGQRWAGISPVCDACRGMDSRDPSNFPKLEKLLEEWKPRAEAPAVLQLGLDLLKR